MRRFLRVRRFLRDNGLGLTLLVMFLVAWLGQALTGWRHEVAALREHGAPALSLGAYLRSGDFLEATFENWESEFLQMAVFLLLGTALRQKGSAESRPLEESVEDPPPPLTAESPWPARRGGWPRGLYAWSLSIAFSLMFLFSFALHAIGSRDVHNVEARLHGQPDVSLADHVRSSEFWFESFQNWQSEFLSVLAMVILSIWLRQEHSPESKDVNTPHHRTGP